MAADPDAAAQMIDDATNSQIVLGENGGESLLGKGDILREAGRGVVRAQSCFIPQVELLTARRT
jgi:DNA segregation ATPase FtsK/SpoIIIE-like protein